MSSSQITIVQPNLDGSLPIPAPPEPSAAEQAQAQLQQIQANLHSNERLQIDDTLTALATAAAGR